MVGDLEVIQICLVRISTQKSASLQQIGRSLLARLPDLDTELIRSSPL